MNNRIIKPDEVIEAQKELLDDEIIEAINSCIVKNYANNKAIITLTKLARQISEVGKVNDETGKRILNEVLHAIKSVYSEYWEVNVSEALITFTDRPASVNIAETFSSFHSDAIKKSWDKSKEKIED